MKWLKALHEQLGTTKYRFHKTELQRKLEIMNKETTQAKQEKKSQTKIYRQKCKRNKDYMQK